VACQCSVIVLIVGPAFCIIGIGHGGAEGQIQEKIFLWGKNRVRLGHFVNFSGKYVKIWPFC